MEQRSKKDLLKQLIRRLHDGEPPDKLKVEFRNLLAQTQPHEIAQIEQELIEEGIPREEIQRLCDLHLEVFREALERVQINVPPGHPLHILMEEHKLMLEFARELEATAQRIARAENLQPMRDAMELAGDIAHHFTEYERHMEREENALFPFLEKHGVTQPPAIMWSEHNEFRDMRKQLLSLLENASQEPSDEWSNELVQISQSILSHLTSHYYKENNILFAMALRFISPDEWRQVRADFDEIGYCCFTPHVEAMPAPSEQVETAKPIPTSVETGVIELETGTLSIEQLEGILNALPVDVTFVDADDTVRYFNNPKEGRIFVRTRAVLGRKVQQCHPQSSIHLVNTILDDFRSGRRDVAEFWIQRDDKLIHIRYFPVRDRTGHYLGCIEVTQDITKIKQIEGEKRLLE